MMHRQRRTAEHDNREAPERTCEAWAGTTSTVVRIGRATRFVPVELSEARAVLSRMGRQPAPLIWRALGVEA